VLSWFALSSPPEKKRLDGPDGHGIRVVGDEAGAVSCLFPLDFVSGSWGTAPRTPGSLIIVRDGKVEKPFYNFDFDSLMERK
jgi:hypothetical protein